MDAGYDYQLICEQVSLIGAQSVIAYRKKKEPEPIGVEKYFTSTCVRHLAYRYDSYNAKYKILKYTRPNECKDCPLVIDCLV